MIAQAIAAAGVLVVLQPAPAFAAERLAEPSVLSSLRDVITDNGYACTRIIGAWTFGSDEIGNQIRVVCPGNSIEGTRYRVSVNNETKRVLVRVGW
jgi:hypothetical protein